MFEAITLHAASRPNESIATLLDVVVDFVHTPDIERYKPSDQWERGLCIWFMKDP
ncbi:hypothetical protein HD598_001633 [Neomicrococcus aestuarii]|uniref:Uncharacterized protein n=1 Tax=Neomicrococcus aestuarii TaxID=556325 RepID=A0A7W8WZ38_9MICC|nr:hypothetical protein [Neomicrococcus aestuarii]